MFNKARFKLTAWYLLIIMLISIAFSAVIYIVLTKEVERFAQIQRLRIERRLRGQQLFDPGFNLSTPSSPFPNIDSDLVKEAKQRIILLLAIINGSILIVSGGLGYLLAGKTLKPIQEMVDEQNRFISDASHELRTPLTSLKTAMEVTLRDKNFSLKEAKTVMIESVREVNKLQSLSDELLQIAQYQKPNGNLQFGRLSVLKVVKEALQKIKPLANQKQVVIKSKVIDFEIEGNSYSLIDLLVIILDNAVKYSPNKTMITVRSQKTNKNILLSISDKGIGIKENDLPHIFDRFYRANTARSNSSTHGYGLGLSIAKRIINLHHGIITVESKLKKGTTFNISLPIKQRVRLNNQPLFS